MDSKVSQIILVLITTTITLISTQFNSYIIGCAGIALAVFLYFFSKIRYFSIASAVLGLLYAISFIPLSAFVGSMMMIVWGEVFLGAFEKFNKPLLFFGIGSAASLIASAYYIGSFEPLICLITIVVVLMLRSILKEREDGSMITLIGAAMTITLFEDLMFSADIRTISFAAVLCAAFGYFAYRAKTIDISGVFASVLFGIILIIFANVMWFFVVLMFFIAGSIFTKYKYDKKRRMGVEQRKSGRRGYKNAFANVGVAVAASILYGISGGNVIFSALFVGSLATATADTLASEIGVTSSKPPRMITNFKVCRPGTNGGVTLAGEAASLIGSFVISAASFMMGICPLYVAVICVFIGFIGNNLDSLYGALIENKGIIGNSGTNLLATLSGGLAALGITAALISLNLV